MITRMSLSGTTAVIETVSQKGDSGTSLVAATFATQTVLNEVSYDLTVRMVEQVEAGGDLQAMAIRKFYGDPLTGADLAIVLFWRESEKTIGGFQSTMSAQDLARFNPFMVFGDLLTVANSIKQIRYVSKPVTNNEVGWLYKLVPTEMLLHYICKHITFDGLEAAVIEEQEAPDIAELCEQVERLKGEHSRLSADLYNANLLHEALKQRWEFEHEAFYQLARWVEPLVYNVFVLALAHFILKPGEADKLHRAFVKVRMDNDDTAVTGITMNILNGRKE